MTIQNYDIVGSYNNQRVSSIDAERSVNLFEYLDPLGKKPKSLINTSGLINTEITFPAATGGFRAQFVFDEFEYSVIGVNVYRTSPTGATSQINTGPIAFSSSINGYVGIDANTFQIIFVDGAFGWIYDTITGIWSQITDASFPLNPIDVCYLDGFFNVANGETNNFYLSSFNQGLIWGTDGGAVTFTMAAGSSTIVLTSGSFLNYQVGTPVVFAGGGLPAELVAGTTYFVVSTIANQITVSATPGGAAIVSGAGGGGTLTNNGQLQVGSITTHPGEIVACRTLYRRLFLFSENYTEVWENAGAGGPLPFRRNNSLLMEFGTPAIGSISVSFDMMIFLSQSKDGLGSVMQVIGTESIPISNRALDFQLAQYAANPQDVTLNPGVSDCRGFLIKENGLIFYRMNFTYANHTFVYNATLSNPTREEGKLWHEEEVLNGNRHPAQTHAYFNGVNYVGHYSLPILYQIDSQTFSNDGESIRRMRITKAVVPPGYQRLRIDRFQIDLLQGNVENENDSVLEQDLATEALDLILTEDGLDLIVELGMIAGGFIDIPYAFLSISKDGGQTYGYRLRAPMGDLGQRTYRTLWRKLGTIPRGQAFVCKVEFFDQIPIVILGASWGVDVLPE